MYGELHCLNCARHLADIVITDGRPQLTSPQGRADRPMTVRLVGRSPRCARCGGKAMLNRPLDIEMRGPRGEDTAATKAAA